MDELISAAVIFGSDNFVAEKLILKLREQGIKVVNGDIEEILPNSTYVFDFIGREDEWNNLSSKQRLVLIKINDMAGVSEWENKLKNSQQNWRIVVGNNVYGEGMSEEGFLGRAFLLAAKNKNLVLPSLNQVFRALAVDDLVEAILRACFFSGTMGKTLLIGGRETNSKIVAEALLDEAKMTRTKVIQDDQLVEEADDQKEKLLEESGKLLRWQAEITFKEGAKAAVQYFVAKVDADNRKKSAIKENPDFKKTQVERREVQNRYEVEIEEEEMESKALSGVGEEREIEIEIETEQKMPEILSTNVQDEIEETKEEEIREEEIREEEKIRFESFKKSPLPERKIEEVRNENKEMASIEKDSGILEKNISAPEEKKDKIGRFSFPRVKSWWWMIGGALLFFGVVGLIFNIIKMLTIPKKILGVQTFIEEGKYEEARKEIETLSKDNSRYFNILGKGKIGTILRSEAELVDLLDLGLKMVESGERISQGLFGDRQIEMGIELQNIEKNLDMTISKLGILQGRLSGQWLWLPGRFRGELNELKDKLGKQKEEAEKLREMLTILPEMLGLDGKRRDYMVLLQNENEIRASGGFIGSYAILSFEAGRFLGFEVRDVYEADGQLKGHVEPPEEIKKYLGEAGWFMRDANWQASFPLVSRDIQWFLEKETGRKVDGVIGLNLAAVKSVLGAIGEIYVPDFKEKVNESNLFELAEFYSDNKFFAGSGQKASFLGGVSKQLMEEIKLAKGNKGQKLLTVMIEELEQNEIQIALNDAKSAGVLAQAGWDGSIYEGKCANPNESESEIQSGCLADYLFVVESNMGVNKANYFLYRNIERQIEIEEKMIKNTLKIVYENTAKSNAWPAGDYKNYLRIYLPVETRVEEVGWNEDGSGEKKVVSGEDLKIKQIGNKKEVGFLITVPIGKKIEVEVKYSIGVDLSNWQTFSYLNYIQRQSGFGETNIVTLVSLPDGWQIGGVEPVASVVGGKLLFNQKLEKDIKMGVEISR